MSFEEMVQSSKETLTPADVAEVLGCKPYSINVQVKADPASLGFPVAMIGSTVRIPRRAFLAWLTGRAEGSVTNDQGVLGV